MFLSFLMAFGAAVRARTTRGVAYTPMSGARLDIYRAGGRGRRCSSGGVRS